MEIKEIGSSDEKSGSEGESPPTRVPPASGLFRFLLLVRFFGGGDFLSAVQERTQRHPAEHIAMSLLDELHQLADVAVQTLRGKRAADQREGEASESGWEQQRNWADSMCARLHGLFL